jgi:hypothetical protein
MKSQSWIGTDFVRVINIGCDLDPSSIEDGPELRCNSLTIALRTSRDNDKVGINNIWRSGYVLYCCILFRSSPLGQITLVPITIMCTDHDSSIIIPVYQMRNDSTSQSVPAAPEITDLS